MPIPPVDGAGRLPAAAAGYAASLTDVEELFVRNAPNAERRAAIFKALEAWVAQASTLFGEGRLLIDGGFVTHKPEAPEDVDLVFIPDDPDRANMALATADGRALLTQFDVVTALGVIPRLQPMAGLVDGFLADPRRPDRLAYWHQQWSRVKNDPHSRKGYVEVVI